MSRARGETIGPRIRTCQFVDASGRCSDSNRADQRNGFCPFMPQSRTHPTSNAISFPAIRSALSEAKRFRMASGNCGLNKSRAPRLSFGRSKVYVTTPFSRIISRASRIPIRSAGIDPPLGLPKGRPDQANGGARQSTDDPGRDHSVMGGAIISESGGGIIPLRGAASSRNWGAASLGISIL